MGAGEGYGFDKRRRGVIGGRMNFKAQWVWTICLAGMLVAGCGRTGKTEGPAQSDEVRHALTGQIILVDAERGTLLVDHDEIPGYMPRMAMEFVVNRGDLANAREGMLIRGELVEGPNDTFLLEKIWPIDPVAEAALRAGEQQLRQETSIRGRRAYREVGENLPDFALYDQTGAVVSPHRFRGKQVMLNFIFTRCPVATMCPAATFNMMEAQRLAKEAGVGNIEFVSITLDPEYDTPGVLREYAEARGIDTTNFSFLTGPEGAIRDLLTQFGILTRMEDSVLTHTLATMLVNEQGRIVWRHDGTQWNPADFVRRMRVE